MSNEMTNQAAQTMPLPEPVMQGVHPETGEWRYGYPADQMHQYARDYAAALSQAAGAPSWIVNDLGELGVMVNGVAYFLYKGDNIVYEDAKHDDGSPMLYRMVGKREFGEVCRPRHWEENGWAAAHRYTQELIYTPGLSFGKPEDGDWCPLPAQGAAPAASGGEDDRSGWCRSDGCVHKKFGEPTWKEGDSPFQSSPHPDALPDGTLSKSTAKRVTALAAASVSERARELLAAEYDKIGLNGAATYIRSGQHGELDKAIIRAIEQALTQQRAVQLGDFQDKALAWDAVCEILNVVHPNWHANGRTGMQAAIITIQKLAHTTPQPSADAVRELAATWRKRAERKRFVGLKNEALLDEAHADELESLLSGGSHA